MNLKKVFISLVFVLAAMCMCAYAKTAELNIGSTDAAMMEDSVIKDKILTAAPYAKGGRTYVPVRFISEFFGADVKWVPSENQVVIKNDDTEIVLRLGSRIALVNGSETAIDAMPEIVNNTTMVPVRFISEQLEYIVKYIPSTKQVMITDMVPISSLNGENVSFDVYKFIFDLYKEMYEIGDSEEELRDLANTTFIVLTRMYGSYVIGQDLSIAYNQDDYDAIADAVDREYSRDMGILRCTYAEYYERMLMMGTLRSVVSEMVVPENDEEIKNYYKENYMCAQHILLTGEDAEKTARNVRTLLGRGADFDSMADEYSDDSTDPFVFTADEVVDEFAEAVKNLKENKISNVVKTPYGYHIIKRLPLPDFEDYRDEVTLQMTNMEAVEYIDSVISDCDTRVYYDIDELVELLK